jgi:hypothetical protein
MEHCLKIRPTGRMGAKGAIIEIVFNGEVIASGVSPEFAACRELKARGITGHATFWRDGKSGYDYRMPIEWGAAHTVSETDRQGLRFAKWVPHPMAGKRDELEDAA